jgi:hypothetical protein
LTLSPRTSLWFGACLGFFLISRVPAIQCPFQLNVDEGQMLAQAMRYAHDLTPWRSVDGETGGPILSWVLLLGHEVGLPFSFQAEHMIAALCLAGILAATFGVAYRLVGEEAALTSLAAGCLWLALSPDEDFTHYSSELVPCLFISLALLGLVGVPASKNSGLLRIFTAGLLLGLVPWAKLQAVPIALVLGLWALADIVRTPDLPAKQRSQRAGILIAGAILPSALMLAWVANANAWDQFWNSYILANLSRAEGKPWSVHRANLLHLVLFQEGSPWFLDTALLAIGAVCLRGRAGWRALPRSPAVLSALLLAAAVFAVLRPINAYSHYEQLCLVPLLLVTACCVRVILGDGPPAADSKRRAAWAVLAVGILPLPAAYFCHFDGWQMLSETWRYDQSRSFQVQAFVDRAVRQFVPGAESIAVWGWAPYLYVDLGIAPGTRDAGYASMTDGNPSEPFIRAGFIRDLEASSPQVIVDTEDLVSDGVRKTAPDSFPALAAYLRGNYRLVGRGTASRGPDKSLLVDVYLRQP